MTNLARVDPAAPGTGLIGVTEACMP